MSTSTTQKPTTRRIVGMVVGIVIIGLGIALSSDVLASAVSASIYAKHKNLDIKNGLIMMISVLTFTVVGSYISSLLPSATMGSFSVFMTFLLGIKFIVKPVMTTKEYKTLPEVLSRDEVKRILSCLTKVSVWWNIGTGNSKRTRI